MGHSPSRAMAAAQELYVRGEISYPRTDNTVSPPSLPVREILDRLRKSLYHDYVERLLERPELDPSRGPIHTTDHPPIHPTAAPAKRREGLRATVYDRSEEHTSELQSQSNLVCRLLLEKKKTPCRHRLHEHSSSPTDLHFATSSPYADAQQSFKDQLVLTPITPNSLT